jgi:hypothetical protein
MYPTHIDPLAMIELADDFLTLDTSKWSSVDDGATGTNTLNAVAGGEASIVTAGADNDYHVMASAATPFKIADKKTLFFVARFSLTEANTDDANWVLGLTSVTTSGFLAADGGGPASSYSGAVLFKVDGTMSIQFETSIGSAQVTNAALADFTSGVVYQAGFAVDTFDGTYALVKPWIYNETTGARVDGPPHKLLIAGQAGLKAIYGVKAGGSAAETLKIDYIRCCQTR